MTERALPEPRSREAHEHVQQLRDELQRIRAEKPGSGYALDAFVRYMREASLLGLNPTALPQHSPVESDRFFARIVQGPDGHRYWLGSDERFVDNDKRTRHPRRWWWEHQHGVELNHYEDVTSHCGDRKCIAPAHCSLGRAAARRRFSDEQMLGALRVQALRLGHTPSRAEWVASGRTPSYSNYVLRFGDWRRAIVAAGLKPRGQGQRT